MIINEQISQALANNYEVWLDWIEETYNFSYDDLEYTRFVLENYYCGQEGIYYNYCVSYTPNGNGSKYGYGHTLEKVKGNGHFYGLEKNASGNNYSYRVTPTIFWGNGDYYSSTGSLIGYGNGTRYIKDE